MMNKVRVASAAVLMIGAGAGGAYWYANERVTNEIDARLAGTVAAGMFEEAGYETARLVPTGAISIKNLRLVQDGLDYTLRNVSITNLDYAHAMPRHLDVAVDGLRLVPVDARPGGGDAAAVGDLLRQLGVREEIPLALRYSLRYDPDNAYHTEFTSTLNVPGSFAFDASTVTRNLDMAQVRMLDTDPVIAQQRLQALLPAAEFQSVRLTLRDEGFLDGLLAMAAGNLGLSPDEYRARLVSQAQNLYLFLPPGDQNVAMAASAELAEFLVGGKTLTVKLAPEYGGKVEQLQQEIMGAAFIGDFNKVGALLHLEITTD